MTDEQLIARIKQGEELQVGDTARVLPLDEITYNSEQYANRGRLAGNTYIITEISGNIATLRNHDGTRPDPRLFYTKWLERV